MQLVQAVCSANPQCVVVLINGGPLSIEWIQQHVPAVLEAFYPGELGGEAIADVIFGLYNPSGRLPVTVYPSAFVQRSVFNMDLRDDGGVTYQWYDNKFGRPLWHFGHGLSYTRWHYTSASTDENPPHTFSTAALAQGRASTPSFSVKVTNSGARDGSVSVLGFVMSDKAGYAAAKLFGFKKIHLKAGESAVVRLLAEPWAFARSDDDGNLRVHSGSYRIHLGGAVGDGIQTMVTLTGAAEVLSPSISLQPNHHIPHSVVMESSLGVTLV